MNIEPVSCFTCGKILGNLWDKYEEEVMKNKNESETFLNINSIKATPEARTFKLLNIKRYCCKRMFLGHKNLTK